MARVTVVMASTPGYYYYHGRPLQKAVPVLTPVSMTND